MMRMEPRSGRWLMVSHVKQDLESEWYAGLNFGRAAGGVQHYRPIKRMSLSATSRSTARELSAKRLVSVNEGSVATNVQQM